MKKHLFLLLALIPTFCAVFFLVWAYLTQPDFELAMSAPIYWIVAIQVVSIVAFSAHAATNKRISSDELQKWLFNFVVLIPFGMISYWNMFIHNDSNDSP